MVQACRLPPKLVRDRAAAAAVHGRSSLRRVAHDDGNSVYAQDSTRTRGRWPPGPARRCGGAFGCLAAGRRGGEASGGPAACGRRRAPCAHLGRGGHTRRRAWCPSGATLQEARSLAAGLDSACVTVSFDGTARVESARDWSCLRTFTSGEVRVGGLRVGPRTAPPSSPRRRLGLALVRSDVCSAAAAGRPHQLELFAFAFWRVLVGMFTKRPCEYGIPLLRPAPRTYRAHYDGLEDRGIFINLVASLTPLESRRSVHGSRRSHAPS